MRSLTLTIAAVFLSVVTPNAQAEGPTTREAPEELLMTKELSNKARLTIFRRQLDPSTIPKERWVGKMEVGPGDKIVIVERLRPFRAERYRVQLSTDGVTENLGYFDHLWSDGIDGPRDYFRILDAHFEGGQIYLVEVHTLSTGSFAYVNVLPRAKGEALKLQRTNPVSSLTPRHTFPQVESASFSGLAADGTLAVHSKGTIDNVPFRCVCKIVPKSMPPRFDAEQPIFAADRDLTKP